MCNISATLVGDMFFSMFSDIICFANAQEIVWADALDRVNIGHRATQKAFLMALSSPTAKLREYEARGKNFERLALLEESKALPWSDIYNFFCYNNGAPVGVDVMEAFDYIDVLSKAAQIYLTSQSMGFKPEGMRMS